MIDVASSQARFPGWEEEGKQRRSTGNGTDMTRVDACRCSSVALSAMVLFRQVLSSSQCVLPVDAGWSRQLPSSSAAFDVSGIKICCNFVGTLDNPVILPS
jgi:hypothetical protein